MSSIDDVESEAYEAWELQDYERAAKLFFVAADLEAEAAAKRHFAAKPDQSFIYRVRAALCLWDGGIFESARPILNEALIFDWKRNRLWGDRHDSEKAVTRLLMEKAVEGDSVGFVELWRVASDRGEAIEFPFPTVVPHQKQLLIAALQFKLTEVCRQILGRINSEYLRKHNDLRILKAQAEDFLAI